MKSIITKNEYEDIYRSLDEVSPIDYDCGTLCGAACCLWIPEDCDNPEDAMGMYLLPGEDKIFSRKEPWLEWGSCNAKDYEFPDSWKGKVYFLTCRAKCHCDRKLRPIQCRSFPLQPHFNENGELVMIYDTNDLPYSCPLIAEREKYPLNKDFVQATYAAWTKLIKDPLIHDLVQMDSEYRIEDELDIISVSYQ